jgi:hypothetical protein
MSPDPWRVCDRLRFYERRGGVYIGGGSVVWPDGAVTWADHCEPDEDETSRSGGRICCDCGHEHRSTDSLCINCAHRPGITPLPAWVEEWWRENHHRYPSEMNPFPR